VATTRRISEGTSLGPGLGASRWHVRPHQPSHGQPPSPSVGLALPRAGFDPPRCVAGRQAL